MQKARAFFVIMLMIFTFLPAFNGLILHAQEEDPDYEEGEDITIEPDWIAYAPDLYSRGDQTFSISMGLIFPTVFFNNGTVVNHHFSPPVGGAFSLAYGFFLSSHLFLGGEASLQINSTLAQNMIYMVPVGVRLGWQIVFRQFEFPLSIGAGYVRHQYLDSGYSGMFINGKASAFYRFNSDWSFGLNADWSWYPEWPIENGKRVPHKNMDGNIVGLTLTARYHF